MQNLISKITEINQYIIGWFPIVIGLSVLGIVSLAHANGCTFNPSSGNAVTIGVGFATMGLLSNKFGKLKPDNQRHK